MGREIFPLQSGDEIYVSPLTIPELADLMARDVLGLAIPIAEGLSYMFTAMQDEDGSVIGYVIGAAGREWVNAPLPLR